jgi:hypothetical protein
VERKEGTKTRMKKKRGERKIKKKKKKSTQKKKISHTIFIHAGIREACQT